MVSTARRQILDSTTSTSQQQEVKPHDIASAPHRPDHVGSSPAAQADRRRARAAEVAILDISTATGTTQVATAFAELGIADVAELGIADVLGDEVLTAAQIAARLGTDAGTTHRLL